ncbi:MAG: ABC transporter ATP-binding protein [Gammaproteobacteria bacterium RIFCSPHIGHO2_12_FULL_45_9]|nr:MAG: ABC transporter ATP-binding protein [Gammaproteobacteria bacterium RIFCSPHIGHO2_12_FULL_45_9]
MSFITLQSVSYHISTKSLFDKISCHIGEQEHICLVGRNGEGKSTFLKLLMQIQEPDAGTIQFQKGITLAYLPQEVPLHLTGAVFDCVAEGLGEIGTLLQRYEHAIEAGDECFALQHELEAKNAWNIRHTVLQAIEACQLDPHQHVEHLSGGLKRRVLLAKALIQAPDVLLLDEPTNHLDIASIEWLEQFLKEFKKTFLVVTHDRKLIESVSNRILEMDRGNLTSWECNYTTYLERKKAALDAEEKANAEFDKKLAQEETWIRQGIKARRTRNEGRVRRLLKIREERKQRRERIGQVNFMTHETQTSGQLVLEADNVSFRYSDKAIIQNFSLTVMRGDRIGIIGPNGCGKTTLIQLLLQNLTPTQGIVRQGTQLAIAYFDQLRSALDETQSAEVNVGEGQTFLTINNQKMHIIGYLQQFLFTPERARIPAHGLSGGERNRLLLAKLFSKSSNFLILDEPTNDLDLETLELLEELLMDYTGTVLCISHDRTFLNNVVTSVIAYEGNAHFQEYVGGYDDWMRQRPTQFLGNLPSKSKSEKTIATPEKNIPTKLSYKEKRELETLPMLIEELEGKMTTLQTELADPQFYQTTDIAIQKQKGQLLQQLSEQLEKAYLRWSQL